MPLDPVTASLILGGVGKFRDNKIQKAEAGLETYTKPKTIFGKIIGGISGRTAAAAASEEYKSSPISEKVMSSIQPKSYNLDPSMREGFPVTGGVSFGGEATKKTYLPFYIVGAIVAIFYFMRRKGGRRRR